MQAMLNVRASTKKLSESLATQLTVFYDVWE